MKYRLYNEKYKVDTDEKVLILVKEGNLTDNWTSVIEGILVLSVGKEFVMFNVSEWGGVAVVDGFPPHEELVATNPPDDEFGPPTKFACPRCNKTLVVRLKGAGVIMCPRDGTQMVCQEKKHA